LDDAFDVTVEAAAVVGGEVLGGEDDDRNAASVGDAAEFLEESEAIHLGHHEVEEDKAGGGGAGKLERDATVFGFVDGPAILFERGLEDGAGVGIILDDQKNAAIKAREAVLSSDSSPVKIMVIPANEELVVAREVKRLLDKQQVERAAAEASRKARGRPKSNLSALKSKLITRK